MPKHTSPENHQLLHLVSGGELECAGCQDLKDVKRPSIAGIYPDCEEAYKACKDLAHRRAEDARRRYFTVHRPRLMDPEAQAAR
jgi:hypothetical protein